MKWSIPKIWEGSDVWIIGGGASIPTQFGVPQSVINDVLNKTKTIEAYSPYMSSIHNKHVIGVNIAYKLGNWLDIVFFGDNSFFLENYVQLAECPFLKVSCHPSIIRHNWVKYVAKNNEKVKGISEHPTKISWNYNSGAAAINVAYHLGAKRVILLGFDMCLENDKQHWHSEYGDKRKTKKNFVLPFEKHLKGFVDIAKDAKELGLEIINASPNSAITQFRKTTVKEILNECS